MKRHAVQVRMVYSPQLRTAYTRSDCCRRGTRSHVDRPRLVCGGIPVRTEGSYREHELLLLREVTLENNLVVDGSLTTFDVRPDLLAIHPYRPTHR